MKKFILADFIIYTVAVLTTILGVSTIEGIMYSSNTIAYILGSAFLFLLSTVLFKVQKQREILRINKYRIAKRRQEIQNNMVRYTQRPYVA